MRFDDGAAVEMVGRHPESPPSKLILELLDIAKRDCMTTCRLTLLHAGEAEGHDWAVGAGPDRSARQEIRALGLNSLPERIVGAGPDFVGERRDGLSAASSGTVFAPAKASNRMWKLLTG